MQFAMAVFAVVVGLLSVLGEAAASSERLTVTPVQKVVEMLNSMLVKGKEEKHTEAVQFATYKQFCDDSIAEKTSAVTKADEQKELLTANIQTAQITAEDLAREVQELDAEVATWQGNIKAATKVREMERNDYTVAHKDYTDTIDAITRAVQVLKSQAKNTAQAPVALLSKMQGANPSLEVAKKVVAAFLSRVDQDPLDDPEAYAYESRSGGVVDMLEQLKDKFATERSDLEKEEMAKRHAFELETQDLQKSVSNAENERSNKVQQKAQHLQSAAEMTSDLSDVTSTRKDDSQYVTEMTATCNQKSKDFEERAQLRADEISAITQAIEILSSGQVMGASDKYLASMAQIRKSPALAQLRSLHQSPNLDAVATYLTDQGEKIHSRVLTALAIRARDDPLGKVKKMIQDLIMRLMEEAGEEAQQKTFCDQELTQNEATRTAKEADVERYQSQIDEKTSQAQKLAQEITQLTKQAALTDQEVAELTKIRQEEKAENEQTIKDSQEAQTAVGQAVTVLKEFYAKSAQATALVQGKGASKQEPPPIFNAAYTGMGGESGGVISMLEVIQSDFARLESTTSAEEATSQQTFDRQMSESAVLKAQTQRDIEHKTTQKQNNQQSVVDYNNDLTSAKNELEAANAYFERLKPQCLDSGVSYEDRAARRQEEIQSLQEALRILNGEDIGAR